MAVKTFRSAVPIVRPGDPEAYMAKVRARKLWQAFLFVLGALAWELFRIVGF